MRTHKSICKLTGTEKTFDLIADGFCVSFFKNGKGQTSVTLYRAIPDNVDKVCNFVAERHANDLPEIKDDLKFNGVNDDISNQLNDYLISKL